VVARAMAKRPDDRYRSAGELGEAVRDVVGHEPAARAAEGQPTGRRRTVVGGAVAAVAAVLAIVIVSLAGRHSSTPPSRPSTTGAASVSPTGSVGPSPPPLNSAIEVAPAKGTVVTTVPDVVIRTGGGNPRVAVGEGAVWFRTSGIAQIDEQTGKLVKRIDVGGATFATALSLAVGYRTVWVPSSSVPNGTGVANDATVVPVDPATGKELRTIPIATGTVATDVAVGAGGVWLTLTDGSLVEVDPGTLTEVHRFHIGGKLDTLAVGFGSVWVLDEVAGKATRVNPSTGKPIAVIPVSGNARVLSAGLGAMWVLDTFAGTVASIDPTTNQLGPPIRVGDQPTGMSVGLGAVWVSDAGGSIYRVDPITRSSTPIAVGAPLTAIAFDASTRSLWLAVGGA
jgi:hypothetical protein